MSFLQKITGLIAFIGLIPAADAVTARPGVMNAATTMSAMGVSAAGSVRRMPTMTAYINGGAISGGTTGSTGTTSSSSSNLMDDIDCIEDYTECMKSEDACGTDFEECTTNVLFHAQMPNCVSVLAQCKTSGINSLFGTSNVSALSNVVSANKYNKRGKLEQVIYQGSGIAEGNITNDKENVFEVTKYAYPTDGSVMGQAIIAAAIENKYDVQTCVKRYMNCLHRDDVCGPDFELCTSERDLKKQALFCDSTLARCPADGVVELFGSATWRPNVNGSVAGRVAEAIKDGADLAAANAVNTCYKVVDRCFLGACAANPLRCIEGTSVSALQLAQGILEVKGGVEKKDDDGNPVYDPVTASDVVGGDTITTAQINRYLRASCVDTIGSNKYCHMTYFGEIPKEKDLKDSELMADVFADAYNSRRAILESKVQGLMQEFDTKAKKKCSETIKSCAMRSCAGGSGAACYTAVLSNGSNKMGTIAGTSTYDDIKTGCEAIVNTDKNCLYAVQSIADDSGVDDGYSYMFSDASAFAKLFPKYEENETNAVSADPIGVIGELNALLMTSYNDAAIAQMRRSCQLVAEGCVRNMCGTEFENCYRRRTDVMSTLTQTGEDAFDNSMNKVDGVLDYGTILGMCVGTIKGADACAEHLAISKARVEKELDDKNVWGTASSVRDGWLDAGNLTLAEADKVQKVNENNEKICTTAAGAEGVCNKFAADGTAYTEPVYQERSTFAFNRGADNLFKELIYDLEIEAQAKYKAALTKEQNMCMSYNQGGIRGAMNESTVSPYMWVKLKGDSVPKDYAMNGLTSSQIQASNDLFDSFCRARVEVTSTDPLLKKSLKGEGENVVKLDETTRYFAVGDTFTCGSWLSMNTLEELAKKAGENARTKEKEGQMKGGIVALISILGGGGAGAIAGTFIGDKIQDNMSNAKGKKADADKKEENLGNCQEEIDKAITSLNKINSGQGDTAKDQAAAVAAYKGNIGEIGLRVANAFAYARAGGIMTNGKAYKNANDNYEKFRADSNCTNDTNWKCEYLDDLRSSLEALKTACVVENADVKKSDTGESVWDRSKGKILGGLLTSAAGVGITAGITKAIQKQNLDKAQQEAIQVFMDEIGSKIQCVVAGNTTVNYGDTITLTLE